MALSVRNPRTNCKRRQPPKYTSYRRRAESIYIRSRRVLRMVWDRLSTAINDARDATVLLIAVLARFVLEMQLAGGLRTHISDALAEGALGIAHFLRQRLLLFGTLRIVDESIADMRLDEENAPTYRRNRRYKRIQDFIDDNEAKNLTNFKKPELVALLGYYDLAEWIFVPISDDGEHCYKFHREELLLYMLIFMIPSWFLAIALDAAFLLKIGYLVVIYGVMIPSWFLAIALDAAFL